MSNTVLSMVSPETIDNIAIDLATKETGVSTRVTSLQTTLENIDEELVLVDYIISHHIPKVLFVFSGIKLDAKNRSFWSYVEFYEVNTIKSAMKDYLNNKKIIERTDPRYILLVLESKRILNYNSYNIINLVERIANERNVPKDTLYEKIQSIFDFSDIDIDCQKGLFEIVNQFLNSINNEL